MTPEAGKPDHDLITIYQAYKDAKKRANYKVDGGAYWIRPAFMAAKNINREMEVLYEGKEFKRGLNYNNANK